MVTGIIAKGRRLFSVALAAIVLAHGARAEVVSSSADGFFVAEKMTVAKPSHDVFVAIGQVGQWWSGQHSWSGKSANLALDVTAGGCFCERWADGSMMHGQVIGVMNDKLIRIRGALGPLQAMAVTGILDFSLKPADGKTLLTISYRVSGNQASGLDRIAPAVDGVLGEQIKRLASFIENGTPDAGPSAKP